MQFIQWLYNWGNLITGTLPTELGMMLNLKDFYFAEELVDGTIPTELGLLSGIQTLELSENLLSGTIPTELSLIGWEVIHSTPFLHLDNNNLNGTIPFLGNLSKISLYSNDLTGTFPIEYASWETECEFDLLACLF